MQYSDSRCCSLLFLCQLLWSIIILVSSHLFVLVGVSTQRSSVSIWRHTRHDPFSPTCTTNPEANQRLSACTASLRLLSNPVPPEGTSFLLFRQPFCLHNQHSQPYSTVKTSIIFSNLRLLRAFFLNTIDKLYCGLFILMTVIFVTQDKIRCI